MSIIDKNKNDIKVYGILYKACDYKGIKLIFKAFLFKLRSYAKPPPLCKVKNEKV